jgi:predicted DsbA family dithiol-disulfide isomerase
MAIRITHYSDVLCVWAFIAQVRVAELQANFADDIAFDYRYFGVFGDVNTKMAAQWQEKGGLPGYAAHVQETAAKFEHVHIHDRVWIEATPTSSMPAHVVLCAARAASGDAESNSAVLALDHEIRRAFFEDATDISQTTTLLEICERQGMDVAAIEGALQSGGAHAALSTDLKQAQEFGVRASPTLTFNEGRQTLTGNVGYRVMEANVRELINEPQDQHSWC